MRRALDVSCCSHRRHLLAQLREVQDRVLAGAIGFTSAPIQLRRWQLPPALTTHSRLGTNVACLGQGAFSCSSDGPLQRLPCLVSREQWVPPPWSSWWVFSDYPKPRCKFRAWGSCVTTSVPRVYSVLAGHKPLVNAPWRKPGGVGGSPRCGVVERVLSPLLRSRLPRPSRAEGLRVEGTATNTHRIDTKRRHSSRFYLRALFTL